VTPGRILQGRMLQGRNLERRLRLSVLLLTLIAIAPGCAVDQKKEVAKYRRVLDGDQPAPHLTYSPEETLTLDKAMRLANQDNERIALAGEDYLQALINKDRATSAFLPTVTIDPNYTVTDRPSSSGGTGSGAVGTIGGFKVVGGTLHLLVPLGVLVAVFVVGYRVFDRAAPRIAEEL